jgi:hypothetical protein
MRRPLNGLDRITERRLSSAFGRQIGLRSRSGMLPLVVCDQEGETGLLGASASARP